MIDYNLYSIIPLSEKQDEEYIETTILSVLKEQKLSLSQVRYVFNRILAKIETENSINL